MFKLDESAATEKISVTVDGEQMDVPADSTVAAVLLEKGNEPFRSSTVTGEPRSPHCLMGVCYECLCEIDGHKNKQACMEKVHAGMTIKRQIKDGGV